MSYTSSRNELKENSDNYKIVKRKGSNLPINATVGFVIAILAGVVFLGIVLPLLMNQEGASQCVGPYKGVASVIADMTGINICG